MAGNVREWTSTEYDRDYGDDPCNGGRCVDRGGTWNAVVPSAFRAAGRLFTEGDEAQDTVGFRCAR